MLVIRYQEDIICICNDGDPWYGFGAQVVFDHMKQFVYKNVKQLGANY